MAIKTTEAVIDLADPKAYVTMIAVLHAKQIKPDSRIVSPAQLIAENGVSYEPKFGRCAAGPVKNCFGNAANMATFDPRLTYVEGWATPSGIGLALEHAWCVDRKGKVYDPTWTVRRGNRATAYFGVPVPMKVLQKVMVKTRHYSVFGQWMKWEEILPLLRREMPEWFGEKNGRQR